MLFKRKLLMLALAVALSGACVERFDFQHVSDGAKPQDAVAEAHGADADARGQIDPEARSMDVESAPQDVLDISVPPDLSDAVEPDEVTEITEPDLVEEGLSPDACEPDCQQKGCQPDGNGDDCDDSNPCTKDDKCQDGECIGIMKSVEELEEFKDQCQCEINDDCLPLQEAFGNLCEGKFVCEESSQEAGTWLCVVDPTKAIVPANDCDPKGTCQVASCDPEIGCVYEDDVTLCDDDDTDCTVPACVDGVCSLEPDHSFCQDENPCTENETCEPEKGCTADILAGTVGDVACCSDKNDCLPDSACLTWTCNQELNQCQSTAAGDGQGCDDGNACTIGDNCQAGVCDGTPTDCDDSNKCTADSCNAQGICENVYVGDGVDDDCCDDHDDCGAAVDFTPCMTWSCFPASYECDFATQFDGFDCGDGDACNGLEVCLTGVCQPGSQLDCDDQDPCTVDSCDAAAGCQHLAAADGTSCDDHNECTVDDKCKGQVCVPASVQDCDDGNECTTDSCDPETGECGYDNVAGPCDDGNPCTVGDECASGSCDPGPKDVACAEQSDSDHDGFPDTIDECPYAYDQGLEMDANDIPGEDACEKLTDHGDFPYTTSLTLTAGGLDPATRRTAEPFEIPLVYGLTDRTLEGYWRFDGSARDYSGRDNHGLSYGTSPTTGAYGDPGSAYSFDGDDYVLLDDFAVTTEGSLCLWLQLQLNYNADVLFGQVKDSGARMHLSWSPGGTNHVGFFVQDENGATVEAETSTSFFGMNDGAYHHYCFAWNLEGGQVEILIDGELRERTMPSQDEVDIDDLSFGKFAIGGLAENAPNVSVDYTLKGAVDEVVYFSRMRVPRDILAYLMAPHPFGSSVAVNAQVDFDDVRVVEAPGPGEAFEPFVTRSRIIGRRPHSDSPCPAGDLADPKGREDLCGVVGYWRFDEDLLDSAGTYHAASQSESYAPGVFGWELGHAANFWGDQKIDLPGINHNTEPALYDQSLTIEAWFQWNGDHLGAKQKSVILGHGSGFELDNSTFSLYVEGESKLTCGMTNAFGTLATASRDITPGSWTHAACTYDGSHVELYVDGIWASQAPLTADLATSLGSIHVGVLDPGTPSYWFQGAVDEVLLHNVVKSRDYIYHRANPGAPTIRFLANTVVANQATLDSPQYPVRPYELHWGDTDAPMLRPFVHSGSSSCYGLLNECLGYQGFWDFGISMSGGPVDTSTFKRDTLFGMDDNRPEYIQGLDGIALKFENTDEINVSGDFKFDGSFSVEALMRAEGANGRIVSWAGASQESWAMGLVGWKGKFGQNGLSVSAGSQMAMPNNTWRPLAGVHQDSKWLFYETYNQVSTASALPLSSAGLNPVLGIGHRPVAGDADDYLQGSLDMLRITSRALAEDEFLHFPRLTGEYGCVPDCVDKQCGPDGCGGLCGDCDELDECILEYGVCISPTWGLFTGASFTMGTDQNESAGCVTSLENPTHEVTLTHTILASDFEVTRQQWQDMMQNDPSYFKDADWPNNCEDMNCPVERVNWYEALYYCNKLSSEEGLEQCYELEDCAGEPGSGCEGAECPGEFTCDVAFKGYDCNGYRLPTEAEWEYLARAGTKTPLAYPPPNGTDMDDCDNGCPAQKTVLDDYAHYCFNAVGHTYKVGEKSPNAWNLYDMAGNVFEWVWDDLANYSSDDVVDPLGGDSILKVIRGGSYKSEPKECRSDYRTKAVNPNWRASYVGFRPVRTVSAGQCIPACGAVICGDDGCGGSCGECGVCDDGNGIPWDGCNDGEIVEFQVNTTGAGEQRHPAVTTLIGGRYAVVWDGAGSGDTSGVYARIFNGDDTPASGEFQVNSESSGPQANPSVTWLADGGFIVAWESDGQDGDGYGAYARRFANSGKPMGQEFQLSNLAIGDQRQPALAGFTDSGFVGAWVDTQSGDSNIYVAVYDSDGTTLAGPKLGNYIVGGDQVHPVLVTHGDEAFSLLWQTDSAAGGQGEDVEGTWFFENLEKQDPDDAILNTTLADDQIEPAMGAGFHTITLWSGNGQDGSGYGIFAQRHDPFGPTGEEMQLNEETEDDQRTPAAAWLGGKRFAVAWQSAGQDGAGWGIVMRLVEAEGNLGPETVVNKYTSGDQQAPAMAGFQDGSYVLVWESADQDGNATGIFAQRFDPNGNVH